MAADGSLCAWAEQFGPPQDRAALHAIPGQEKQRDEKLSRLATATVNADAAGA